MSKEEKTKKETTTQSVKIATTLMGKAQKNMEIARTRGFTNKELLQYDLLDCSLFDETGLARHRKHELMTQIEGDLTDDDYSCQKISQLKTVLVVDFMSVIRKIPFKSFKNVREVFQTVWNLMENSCNAKRIEVIYDSYLERSIKESERLHRCEVQPIDVINLTLESTMPVELESFWGSATNKYQLQTISREYFTKKSLECNQDIILSGYVTDAEGEHNAIAVINGSVMPKSELNSFIEEADSRMIPHIAKAGEEQHERVLVMSNDTDVVIYNLAYFSQFKQRGVKQLWIRFGSQDKKRDIPIHSIAEKFGDEKCLALLKAHILTGCDVTSRIGTKAAAVKARPELYLQHFGEEPLRETALQQAEKYLVKVIDFKSNCETFDELRYKVYTLKGKTLNLLPPTSTALSAHLQRCHYFVNMCLSLLQFNTFNLQPNNYGWSVVNGMLIADKNLYSLPNEYLTKCGCKTSCTRNCGCQRRGLICTEYCKCQNCENI